jgi:hypothetical protein
VIYVYKLLVYEAFKLLVYETFKLLVYEAFELLSHVIYSAYMTFSKRRVSCDIYYIILYKLPVS